MTNYIMKTRLPKWLHRLIWLALIIISPIYFGLSKFALLPIGSDLSSDIVYGVRSVVYIAIFFLGVVFFPLCFMSNLFEVDARNIDAPLQNYREDKILSAYGISKLDIVYLSLK